MRQTWWLVALAALMLAAVGCQQEKTPEAPPAQKPAAEEQKAMTPEQKTDLPVVNEKIEQAQAEEQKALAPEQKAAEQPAAEEQKAMTPEEKTNLPVVNEKIEQAQAEEQRALAPEQKAAEPKAPAPATETPAVAKPKAAAPQPPKTVVYEASYGKVAFAHAAHAEHLGCGSCHDSDPPVKIAIDKEKAHQMCKGCHQEKGAGPTQCGGCHKKE